MSWLLTDGNGQSRRSGQGGSGCGSGRGLALPPAVVVLVLTMQVRLDLQFGVGHDSVAEGRLGEACVLEDDEGVVPALTIIRVAHLQRLGQVERAKAAEVRRDEWDEHGVASDRRELVQVADPDRPVLQLIRRVACGLVGGVEVVG